MRQRGERERERGIQIEQNGRRERWSDIMMGGESQRKIYGEREKEDKQREVGPKEREQGAE